MAAPHVSAVVALLLEADPALDSNEVKARLRWTCRGNPPDPPEIELQPAGQPGNWDPVNWHQQYGHGRVDAAAALKADADGGPA